MTRILVSKALRADRQLGSSLRSPRRKNRTNYAYGIGESALASIPRSPTVAPEIVIVGITFYELTSIRNLYETGFFVRRAFSAWMVEGNNDDSEPRDSQGKDSAIRPEILPSRSSLRTRFTSDRGRVAT